MGSLPDCLGWIGLLEDASSWFTGMSWWAWKLSPSEIANVEKKPSEGMANVFSILIPFLGPL